MDLNDRKKYIVGRKSKDRKIRLLFSVNERRERKKQRERLIGCLAQVNGWMRKTIGYNCVFVRLKV